MFWYFLGGGGGGGGGLGFLFLVVILYFFFLFFPSSSPLLQSPKYHADFHHYHLAAVITAIELYCCAAVRGDPERESCSVQVLSGRGGPGLRIQHRHLSRQPRAARETRASHGHRPVRDFQSVFFLLVCAELQVVRTCRYCGMIRTDFG